MCVSVSVLCIILYVVVVTILLLGEILEILNSNKKTDIKFKKRKKKKRTAHKKEG